MTRAYRNRLDELLKDIGTAEIEAEDSKKKCNTAHQLIFDLELWAVHCEEKVKDMKREIKDLNTKLCLHQFISEKDPSARNSTIESSIKKFTEKEF